MNKEKKKILQVESVLCDPLVSEDRLRSTLIDLLNSYKVLNDEHTFLTKIGDRQQGRLRKRTSALQDIYNKINNEKSELQSVKIELEDVIAQRTAEVQKAYHETLLANKELDTFVYRASHDIKGPIARLIGLSYLGQMEAEEEVSLDYFGMIYKTAQLMNEVLGRLLSVDKIKNKTIEYKEVFLKPIIEKVYDASKEHFVQSPNFDFKINVPDNFNLTSDCEILDLLIYNITEYSIKATSEEEPKSPSLHFDAKNIGEYVEIILSYRGAEIPMDKKEQIFNMFYRTSANEKISGMELYVTYLAVNKLKGSIELVSSENKINIFKILLPISE